MNYTTDQIVQVKSPLVIPESVNKQIYLINFWKKGLPSIFGSYIYRMQKYAGDVDLLQNIAYKDEKTAITNFIKSLKKICRELGRYRYFSEFKCGFDPFFKNIEISDIVGELNNGVWTLNKQSYENINILKNNKIITDEEFNEIKFIFDIKKDFYADDTQNGYDYVFNILRNKKILRWTKEEILKGFKMIRNKKYTLSEAIKDNSMIKIDIIALIDNRYIEITNMVSLCVGYYDEENEKVVCERPINIPEKELHNLNNLKREVEKLYYSNKYFSLLKCCKRMFSLVKQLDDDEIPPFYYVTIIKKLSDILMNDNSAFYSVVSEFDTILTLLKNYSGFPYKTIYTQIDNIKNKISNILLLDNDLVLAFSDLINDFKKILNQRNKKLFIESIEKIKDLLKNLSNEFTLLQMYKLDLKYPPYYLLPNERTYYRRPRTLDEVSPIDKYKEFEKFVKKESKN